MLNDRKFNIIRFINNHRGFTLLELLIVISIIGLLAGMIMVSFPGAQKKARIAGGLQFSDSLRGALQMSMIDWWPLDEKSGSIAHDNWFDQNDATLHGNPQWVDGIINGALEFDGNDWVQINHNIGLSGQMTLEFWFKTPNKNANQYFFDNRNPGTWWFIKNYTGGSCGANPGNICFEGRVMALDSDWNINEWTHIAVTDDTSLAKMYINGKLVDTGPGQHTDISTNLRIGTRFTNSQYFQGDIDEVRLYDVAMPMSVIQRHYAQGLKYHPRLAKNK